MKKKKIEKYEPFTITEFTIDWYCKKDVEIEKGYWHNFILTLRYGGGINGNTAWYLTTERFGDGKVLESKDYPVIFIREAVKCYEILPIKEIRTYDNTNGLHEFIKRIASVGKKIF